MNFLLKNIELELDEKYLLIGERMLEEGRISGLYQSENNLWIASAGKYELEMQATPSRVKACTCDCDVFQEEQMCGHLAAGLLLLRKHLSNRKSRTKEKKQNKELLYRKLTVSSITDHISKEELAAFIGQYARGNRQFAIALKTRFATKVPMYDTQGKYAQLLDAVISISRKKNDMISQSSMKPILNALNDLFGQCDDAVALEHYAEATAILQTVIVKIALIIKKLEGGKSQMTEMVLRAFVKLDNLQNSKLPPELKTKLWEFYMAESVRPVYRPNDFAGKFFELMLPLAVDRNKVKSLHQTIDSELENENIPLNYRSALIAVKLKLFEKNKLNKEVSSFTIACLTNPELLFLSLKVAIDTRLLHQAKTLAEKGLRFTDDPSHKIKIQEVLLEIAIMEDDKARIVEMAKNLFLGRPALNYYLYCKTNYDGDWSDFSGLLLSQLQGPPIQFRFELLAQIYAEDASWEKLLDLMEQAGSLEKLQQFDHLLFKTHPQKLISLYKKYLEEYLSQHFGNKPTIRVHSVLNHLKEIKAEAISEKLIAFLKEKYPERLVLKEELEVF